MKLLPALLASSLVLMLSSVASAHEYEGLMKAKKYAEAEKAANAKLSTDANNMDALLVKAQLILVEGKLDKLDEAAQYTEQCIAAHPQSSECHAMLGNVLGTKATSGSMFAAMSYAGKMRDAFIKAIEIDPKNFNARGSLLQFYLQAPAIAGGGKSKAQSLAAETSKVNPAAGSLLQANIDMSDEKFSTAEAAALAAVPGNNEALINMQRNTLYGVGSSYVQQKKYADAERVFAEIQQRYPDKFQGSFGMGRALQEQGKHKEAIALYEKALGMENNPGIFYRLAQCQQALNDKAKAISNYEKALNQKPALSKKLRSDAEEQLKALKT